MCFIPLAYGVAYGSLQVVFGAKGALAGVLGNTAVAIDVEGLPKQDGEAGEMELSGLPFQGSVIVGKKGH
jgi:hypothetical protein